MITLGGMRGFCAPNSNSFPSGSSLALQAPAGLIGLPAVIKRVPAIYFSLIGVDPTINPSSERLRSTHPGSHRLPRWLRTPRRSAAAINVRSEILAYLAASRLTNSP